MSNNEVKKRGWVKNAAIIFLAVMLVLTFFSNTIMNRSLPEVAAQYTTSGSITARIRGSGTVTANEVFEVKYDRTQRVSERPVRVGDEVEIGQLLLRLTGSISEELEQAQNKLRELELALERKIIDTKWDGDLAGPARAVEAAKTNLSNAQRDLAAVNFNNAALTQAQNALTEAENALAITKDALTQAESVLAQAELSLAQANNNLSLVNVPLNSAKAVLSQRNSDLQAAQLAFINAQTTLQNAQDFLDSLLLPPSSLSPSDPIYIQAEQARNNAINDRNTAQAAVTAAQTAVNTAQAAVNTAQVPVDAAQAVVDNAQAAVNSAKLSVTAAQIPNNAAQAVVDARQADVTALQGLRNEWNAANAAVRSAQENLDQAVFNFNEASKSAGVQTSNTAIDIRELNRQISEAKEELETLQKEGGRSEITSPVAGKITSISIEVNQNTTPNEPLMTIEVTDRGYSLNINATAQQASRVNVGDQAEVDRGWWGGNLEPITATLIGIRNDPQNPATGRILHFAMSGGFESGDTLNLVLSQRTENYNIIIPRGALREDANGTFVLIVESRSSPLGNRFIAQRAEVNIIAEDDVNAAVSGALSGWDFIITRSSAPINPGDQVRLADN